MREGYELEDDEALAAAQQLLKRRTEATAGNASQTTGLPNDR